MNTTSDIIASIREQGILPLFYHDEATVCIAIVNALYHAGIRVIEFTNRGPAALENFAALIQYRTLNWPGLLCGAGTIKTVADARSFLGAGADFLISPAFITPIAEISQLENFTWIPGCTTPTEIATAEQYGFTAIKLFPGNLLGPSFVSAIRDIFPGISFMPTGGVTQAPENLKQWFSSGVFAVGLGSQLISKDLLNEKNYSRIGEDTANLLEVVRAIRNPSH
ncbi:bifunctional 4-hydroxy-2-oxoglutarate aldolase/2-dehydro-3-deoxy-phosphogluconate aldolase [Flavihumibacter fluvii]|uniref:bifunctional 4-hydroxy-2-oxoglutarate aldolase/2-dehydro-3-deoxy-phosphogluconate aldolase n=1 Tax=Flavihumibacter fluvii TaxID=2838157 RepID=UPI001BDE7001|nr:bifunctional 4-hydroxy-2-oxoglutarate aldolase/2-dehydro-3-deoxy-phosphogluconate aldolase [Flavihumibacter fluvii]ULQ53558.1 bifunctional 4-hydroxy-2-oxoglutarate aldolase/2-dehydro-3-deoxy-phosphogluconate aldolase [Flavihumibacter fluvii]